MVFSLAAKSFGGGGADGGVILADNTVFPGVVGNGMSMLVGFLGVSVPVLACNLNSSSPSIQI